MARMRLGIVLVVLVASACRIETSFSVIIEEDGSGTLVSEVGMDEEAQSFFLEDAEFSPFEDSELTECAGVREVEEQRGDLRFWVLVCDVEDVTGATDLIVVSASLEKFALSVTSEQVTIAGRTSTEQVEEEVSGFDPAVVEDSISSSISITLPGEIGRHNATTRDGNTLTWSVPVLGGGIEIFAASALVPPTTAPTAPTTMPSTTMPSTTVGTTAPVDTTIAAQPTGDRENESGRGAPIVPIALGAVLVLALGVVLGKRFSS